jgi:hypothetical protein
MFEFILILSALLFIGVFVMHSTLVANSEPYDMPLEVSKFR